MNVIKKIILFLLIWMIFLVTGRKLSANWEAGENINSVRQKYIALTSFAIIVALLIMLVNPKRSLSHLRRDLGFGGRCPVCNHRLIGRGSYCSECGSKV